MWVILLMISLLAQTIIGNSKIGDTIPSGIVSLVNGKNNVAIDNRAGKYLSAKWKAEKNELLKKEESKKEINPSTVATDLPKEDLNKISKYRRGTNSNRKIVSKRATNGGCEECSFKISKKFKVCQNLGEKDYHYFCVDVQGERICKCKPVLFNPWGRERDEENSRSNVDLQTKRSKVTYDWHNRRVPVNGFTGIKRVAEKENKDLRTPFNSWGGKKRADEPIYEERLLISPKNPNRFHIFDATQDEFSERRNVEKPDDVQMVRIKDGTSVLYKDWNLLLDRILLRRNETSEDNYDIYEKIDNRLTMPDKRAEIHQFKKTKPFNPWAGKRDWKTYTFRSVNGYTTKGQKEIFPLQGHD